MTTYLAYDIERGPIETVPATEFRALEAKLAHAQRDYRGWKTAALSLILVAFAAVAVACGGMK
jgi:hypothetical protein